MQYELHPLCTFFPRITGVEFEQLKIDIGTNGQVHPIYLYQGMILDGGNRYRVLQELGIKPKFAEYEGDNPVQFVLSSNLKRRHLTPGQAAAIVSATQDWGKAHPRGGDRKSDQSATLHFDSVADRVELSGASERTQKMADKLVKEASAELVQEVTAGQKSLPQALKEIAPHQEPEAPKHQKKTNPKPDFDPDASQEIDRLIAENDDLKERFAAMAEQMQEVMDENSQMAAVIGSHDELAAAAAEIKRLNIVVKALESRIRGLMNEKNEAIRLAKSWKRRAEKGGMGDAA